MRKGRIHRPTKETDIAATLNIDGHGQYQISTGIRFFDHMLELFAHHGGFDLDLKARGDLDVDQHHTVEDVGIVLGQAFEKALGNKKGILRAGYFLMPMDETLGWRPSIFAGEPSVVGGYQGTRAAGGRSASRTGARFLRRLRPGSPRQRAYSRALWPLQSPQDRILVQGFCARGARGLLAGSAEWPTSFPARRECYDDRHCRLRRRESRLGEEGAGLSGAGCRS